MKTELFKIAVAVILMVIVGLLPMGLGISPSPFSLFFVSFSPIPILLILPVDILCYIREYRRNSLENENLVESLVFSISSGISEEINRWGGYYVLLFAGVILFKTHISTPAFIVASLMFFLSHNLSESWTDGVLLLFASFIYTYILLNYGLFTVVFLHTGFDLTVSIIRGFFVSRRKDKLAHS